MKTLNLTEVQIEVLYDILLDTCHSIEDDLIVTVINDLKEQIFANWVKLTSQEDQSFKYAFNFNFESIDEWVHLKNIFEGVESISNYYISSFNLNNVEGIIEFNGNGNKFELVLSQNDILPVNLGKVYKIQIIK